MNNFRESLEVVLQHLRTTKLNNPDKMFGEALSINAAINVIETIQEVEFPTEMFLNVNLNVGQ